MRKQIFSAQAALTATAGADAHTVFFDFLFIREKKPPE